MKIDAPDLDTDVLGKLSRAAITRSRFGQRSSVCEIAAFTLKISSRANQSLIFIFYAVGIQPFL